MTFITARDLRLKPADVWEKLKKEGDIVVTLNGKPCAIITGVSPETIESSLALIKKMKAELALSKLREKSAKLGLDKLSPSSIDKEIKSARRARK